MALAQESSTENTPETLVPKLPTREGWTEPLFLYNKYWLRRCLLERVMLLRANFKARRHDTVLATNPKCGTTWLKALAFAITNRSRYDFSSHPLLTLHPHQVVPTMEIEIPSNGDLTCIDQLTSPRLLATHMPLSLLPESVAVHGCRIVYICRDPKDAFVSLWHFWKELDGGNTNIHVAFNMFCEGLCDYGPFWDHCLEYWKESIVNPNRVLFVKYEEVMSEPVKFVKKLASFLGDPFTSHEEEGGVPEEVVRLCSFETLSSLNSNQTEVVQRGSRVVKKSAFFRKGKAGGWVNCISKEMGKTLDDIVTEKLKETGLRFDVYC
jgi:estrone sulfotransferase